MNTDREEKTIRAKTHGDGGYNSGHCHQTSFAGVLRTAIRKGGKHQEIDQFVIEERGERS